MDTLALRGKTARGLLELAVQDFRPPERLDVAQYAHRYRMFRNEGGGHVGKWDPKVAPYLDEPMACLTRHEFRTVAVAGPGQVAKSTIGESWLQHSVESDPADFLWYMQTDAALESFVKRRIDGDNGLIALHDGMRARLGPRPIDDSLHFKRFIGMSAELLSATYNNLISKQAPRIIADEIDAWPESLGEVKVLLDIRRQAYGEESKLLMLSHPDRATGLKPERDWLAGIMAIYADSDQRLWWWRCPSCHGYSSPAPLASRVMTLHYPLDAPLDVIEHEARLVCPLAGCLIEDRERRGMNLTGKWVGLGQRVEEDGTVKGERARRHIAGFWIVGLMSPFVLGGIGALARAYAKAAREYDVTGDDKSLREVTVKGLGVPYAKPLAAGSIEAEALAARADPELELGKVPAGVRFLTAWVDVQHNYFEALVRGWGEGRQSWLVDHIVIRGTEKEPLDPTISPAAWDRLVDEVITKRYPLSDGSGRVMSLRAVGFDSSGEAGVTLQGLDAWRRWLRDRTRRPRLVRSFGRVGGRDVWSIVPTKGQAGIKAPMLSMVYPDTSGRKDRASGARGDVPMLLFNPDLFKDALRAQLQVALPGKGYVHFPAALKSPEPPHAFFEQLIAEERDRAGRWSKKREGDRNEALDMMVGTQAVAELWGLSRIDWERPPRWAAPWASNVLVSVFTGDAAPPPPAPIASRLA
jgi:phage terminase large subunit GpA-like protein